MALELTQHTSSWEIANNRQTILELARPDSINAVDQHIQMSSNLQLESTEHHRTLAVGRESLSPVGGGCSDASTCVRFLEFDMFALSAGNRQYKKTEGTNQSRPIPLPPPVTFFPLLTPFRLSGSSFSGLGIHSFWERNVLI